MKNEPSIDVCLCLYNGEKYIREQLLSIFRNATGRFRIIISDGGSTDSSLSIVRDLIVGHPQLDIVLLLSEGSRLKVIQNFSKVLENSTADYVFISDQDDLWSEFKVSHMMASMAIENERFDGPILITTDAKLIDDRGCVIGESLRKNLKQPVCNLVSPEYLIAQNILPGCTFLLNRSAVNLVLPISANSVMHDWWISSLCTLYGRVVYIDEPLHYYRLHSSNLVGQPKLSIIKKIFDVKARLTSSRKFISQTKAIISRIRVLEIPHGRSDLIFQLLKLGRYRNIELGVAVMFMTGRFKKTGWMRRVSAIVNFSLLSIGFFGVGHHD